MPEGHSTFVASACHPSLGHEPVQGRVVFQNAQLRFLSEAITLEIPMSKLELELEEDRVSFRHADAPDWLIYTFDLAILQHSALRQQSRFRGQVRAVQTQAELKRRLKLTFWFLAGFAMLALTVSLLLGWMVRVLVARIPPDFERQFGEAALEEAREEHTFVKDPKLQAEVEGAVAPLISALPTNHLEFKFYIMDEPEPNAFALPGGSVVVTTGLLKLTDKPSELAGAVAHEVAHVTQKHGFRKIISSAGPYLICSVFMGGGGGLLGVLGGGSQILIHQSFSQEYELEADAVGWKYLVAARIDPRGLGELLKKLDAADRKRPGHHGEVAALSSHPSTQKRLRRLEAMWRKLKDKSAFETPAVSQ